MYRHIIAINNSTENALLQKILLALRGQSLFAVQKNLQCGNKYSGRVVVLAVLMCLHLWGLLRCVNGCASDIAVGKKHFMR